MDMDQSLRDTLNQLVSLQAQQLNALNSLAANKGVAAPQFNNSYMNYAPDYMPPMMPFSQGTYQAQQAFNNYASQAGGNRSFTDRLFENKSKISYEQSQAMAASTGARISNAAIAGGGLAASAAGDVFGMFLAPGLIGGLAAGAVGGAALGGLFDIGLKQNQQHMAYNQYLQRESYRFISPSNSTNERDIAGFGQEDRFKAAKFLRHFNTEAKISDEETTMLMEKFTEGGLLKGTKDLEGFKNKMKSLTKYVKESALLLNESFEDITNLMSEMRKAGIDVTNVDYFASKSKVVGAFLGMKASEAGNFAFGTAVNAVRGTAFDAETEQYKRFDSLLYMGGLQDKVNDPKYKDDPRMKEIKSIIANVGGVKEASAIATEKGNELLAKSIFQVGAANFYDWDKNKKTWTFNRDALNEYLRGNKSADELSIEQGRRITAAGPEAQSDWFVNKETYLRNNLGENQDAYLRRSLDALKKSSRFKDDEMTIERQLNMLANDKTQAGKLWAEQQQYIMTDGKDLKRKSQAYGFQQNLQAQINASRVGFGYEVANVWEKTKDEVGDFFTPVGEAATRASTAVSDWWYGKDYKIDRSAIEKGINPSDIEATGRSIAKSLVEGVQKELDDAKNRGYNVNKESTDYRMGVYLTDNQRSTAKNKVYSALATSWGMGFDGSPKSLSELSKKMNTEADRVDTMIEEYNNAKTHTEKALTAWGKLSTNERMGLIQTRESTKLLRGEKKPLSVWDNMTDSDREEVAKISGPADSLTYDPTHKGNADPGKYLRWAAQGGKLKYDADGKGRALKGGNYGEIKKEIEANVKDLEKQNIDVIEKTNAMISGDKLEFSDSLDKEIYGDTIKKTTFKTLNEALVLVNKQKTPGLEKARESLEKIDTLRKQADAFGAVGSTIISAITGNDDDAVDFRKRYNAKKLDKLGLGGEAGMMATGTQEITNFLSSLKGNQAGIDQFIGKLPIEGQTGDVIRQKLNEAFSGKANEQEKLKDVISEITKSYGQSSKETGLGPNAKNAVDAKNGAQTRTELEDEVIEWTKTGTKVIDSLKKSNETLSPQVNQKDPWYGPAKQAWDGLFGVKQE